MWRPTHLSGQRGGRYRWPGWKLRLVQTVHHASPRCARLRHRSVPRDDDAPVRMRAQPLRDGQHDRGKHREGPSHGGAHVQPHYARQHDRIQAAVAQPRRVWECGCARHFVLRSQRVQAAAPREANRLRLQLDDLHTARDHSVQPRRRDAAAMRRHGRLRGQSRVKRRMLRRIHVLAGHSTTDRAIGILPPTGFNVQACVAVHSMFELLGFSSRYVGSRFRQDPVPVGDPGWRDRLVTVSLARNQSGQ